MPKPQPMLDKNGKPMMGKDGKPMMMPMKGAKKDGCKAADQAVASTPFTKVEITSDGTEDGTTIKVNDKEITDLGSFSFCFYNDGLANPVSMNYSVIDPEHKPGTLYSTSYFNLICPKGEGEAKASASLEHNVGNLPTNLMPRNSDDRRKLYAQI